MPTTYRTNDIVEMRAKGTYFGEPFEVIEHFRQQDDFKTAFVWADAMRTYFLNEFSAGMVPAARWISVSVRRISPLPITREETVPIVPLPGGSSGEGMPHAVALLYKKDAGGNIPQNKGRIYIPGLPQWWYVNGVWTVQAIAIMGSTVSRLMNWGFGGGYSFAKWGVASRQSFPVTFNVMQAVHYSGQPATQRRRRPRIY